MAQAASTQADLGLSDYLTVLIHWRCCFFTLISLYLHFLFLYISMPPKLKWKPERNRASCARHSAPRVYSDEARLHGSLLFQALFSLCAACKLSAYDCCMLCFYCHMATVPGADWDQFAYPPGKQSGQYQGFLDKRLPEIGPVYFLGAEPLARGHRSWRRCR